MSRASIITKIGTLIMFFAIMAIPAAAAVPVDNGGVSGRITDQSMNGIANAMIKLVDKSDPAHVYCSGTTNYMGFYQFTGVANTWDPATETYLPSYQVCASANIGGQACEGCSNSFAVEAGSVAAVNVLIVPVQDTVPTPSPTPEATPQPTITVTPAPTAGGISGRVTFDNGTGAANATLMVVDAANYSRVYYDGRSDSDGFYQFTGVDNTWDDYWGSYRDRYIVFATTGIDDGIYEGWSSPFAVEPASAASVNVHVYPLAVNAEPWSPRGYAGNDILATETLMILAPGPLPETPAGNESASLSMPAPAVPAENIENEDILQTVKAIVSAIFDDIASIFG